MNSPKISYVYNCKSYCKEDKNHDGKVNSSSSHNNEETCDLEMLLIGESKNNFDSLEMKLALVKSGDYLGNDAFSQAALFLKIFTRSGVVPCEKRYQRKTQTSPYGLQFMLSKRSEV